MNAKELAAVEDTRRQEYYGISWRLSQVCLWNDNSDFVEWYAEKESIGADYSQAMGRS